MDRPRGGRGRSDGLFSNTAGVVVSVIPLGRVHLLRLLLGLHAPVLEPDFDLTFGKGDGVGDLDPAPPCQVAIGAELLLQLQSLEPGVGLTSPLRCVARIN